LANLAWLIHRNWVAVAVSVPEATGEMGAVQCLAGHGLAEAGGEVAVAACRFSVHARAF
jgi:hypothetical protein